MSPTAVRRDPNQGTSGEPVSSQGTKFPNSQIQNGCNRRYVVPGIDKIKREPDEFSLVLIDRTSQQVLEFPKQVKLKSARYIEKHCSILMV